MYVIDAKSNEVMAKPGYTNVFFTINGALKMPPRQFRYFHCSNFNDF